MLAESLRTWVQNAWVALVTQETAGRPLEVQSCLTGELLPVNEVAQSLSRVVVGDRILVLGECNNTVIALTKLVAKETAPASFIEDHHDEVVLKADRALTLKTPKAKIKITAAGEILIEGTQVIQQAEGVVKISGDKVLLN